MSRRFAQNTTVGVERTKAELEKIITGYGAYSFASMTKKGTAAIAFEMNGKRVVFELPLPAIEDFAKKVTEVEGSARKSAYVRVTEYTPAQQKKRWEQACKQLWRALLLAVKAKLEAVEAGITSFEEEFLAHIMLPDGRTMGKWAIPQIEAAYEQQEMPQLLLGTGR